MEDLRIEVGLPGELLQHDYKGFQEATIPCWGMGTWEFTHTGRIWIEGTLPDLLLQRMHNVHIT